MEDSSPISVESSNIVDLPPELYPLIMAQLASHGANRTLLNFCAASSQCQSLGLPELYKRVEVTQSNVNALVKSLISTSEQSSSEHRAKHVRHLVVIRLSDEGQAGRASQLITFLWPNLETMTVIYGSELALSLLFAVGIAKSETGPRKLTLVDAHCVAVCPVHRFSSTIQELHVKSPRPHPSDLLKDFFNLVRTAIVQAKLPKFVVSDIKPYQDEPVSVHRDFWTSMPGVVIVD